MASVHEVPGGWKVRWNEGGRNGKWRSKTVSSKREALRLQVEIEDALERHGRYEPRRAGRSTALGLICADFITEKARKLAPGTVRNYAKYLEAFKAWVGPHTGADVLSFELLSDYHLHLSDPSTGRWAKKREHRRKPNYILKHITVIEAMWEWAYRRQARGAYVGIPQPDSLELRRQPDPHKRAPTWDDMDYVIHLARGWHRRLYIVLRCTGLRVQQALGLRWDDIVEDGHYGMMLHVRPELGKSAQEKRGRWIPIAPVLQAELAGWGRREGFLIDCGRRKRIARQRDANRAWARARVPEALWRGHPHHAFRAGFVSGLKRLGADDEAVEFLVGHSRGIREAYADADALPLLETVKLVPPLGVGTALGHADQRLKVIKDGGRR